MKRTLYLIGRKNSTMLIRMIKIQRKDLNPQSLD